MKKAMPVLHLVLMLALVGARPASAAGGTVGTGTPASCTEAAFDNVFFKTQSSAGGIIVFNCGAAPHVIVFGASKPVSANTDIRGGGLITLSGGNSSGLFQVFASGTLKLSALDITRGAAASGAIENFGVLSISDARLDANIATVSGGALTNHSTATLDRVVVTGNSATVSGGGIFSDGGTLSVANSEISLNTAGKRGAGVDLLRAQPPISTARVSRTTERKRAAASGTPAC